ncbi:MAG: cell division protein FtsZ [Sphingobacteriales bacterium]|jgi:cell division protein FtsZ
MIQFELPKEYSSIIKVIGVGGGGSNAVNHMCSQDIDGVNFVICNTDAQALALSNVPNRVQLGPHLTQGLGAGANPEIGKQATQESMDEIKKILEVNTKMVFITAGMGGGTGTGGAPIVAKMCQEMGILTVGIVTTPFSYEGKKRIQQAELGIAELKKHVDTLLVISNDKLRHQFGNLTMRAAFSKADNVLATATKCITDVISTTGQINLDFADVCTVMRNGGVAILGSAIANGEDRAKQAIEMAINSPLLNDSDIRGAKWILININSSEGEHEFTMDEVEIIQSYLLAHAGQDANVLLGMGYEPGLGDNISITVIATGFEHKDPFKGAMVPEEKPEVQEEQKIVMQLGVQGEEVKMIHSDPAQPEAALPVEEAITDALAPRLVEPEVPVVSNTINTDNEENDTTEHFVLNLELSNKPELPAIEEVSIEKLEIRNEVTPDSETDMQLIEKNEGEINKTSETDVCSPEYSISKPVVTGGFLSKPSNIYAEEVDQIASPETDPSTVERQNSVELEVPKTEEVNAVVNPLSASVEEEQPEMEMKMVYKETDITEKVEFPVTTRVLGGMEELDMLDDAEEQRRKANDRLQKLRNLSFNLNTADPNNEYDTVPAYVRRNMEMYSNSHLASVEKFYSNYSIKGDDENKGQLSRLNSFLDGKKPD